jgi:hypothetical protein
MITILLSDLVAYGFLREQFTGDLCERRLAARHAAYRRDVPEPHQLVTNAEGPQWTHAYSQTMPRSLPVRRHSPDALLGLRSARSNRGRRP